jgi:hypothetical protein
MKERFYQCIIVGRGLAGAAAVDGIRQLDGGGTLFGCHPTEDAFKCQMFVCELPRKMNNELLP